jgi:hypothetical protein
MLTKHEHVREQEKAIEATKQVAEYMRHSF